MKCGTLLILCLSAVGTPSLAAFDLNHSALTHEYRKYVDHDLVHYKRWQKNQTALNKYLQQLSEISPEELKRMSAEDKKALWLNAYNAYIVKVVLEHYPIAGKNPYYPADSFRQIANGWEGYQVTVAGKKYTLDAIEHDVLRTLGEPEVHFAVVCAAKGCAAPRRQAFVGKTWHKDIAECTEKFLTDKRNVDIEPKERTVKVSQVFKWFPLDFSKSSGLAKKLPPPTDDQIVLAYWLSICLKWFKNNCLLQTI